MKSAWISLVLIILCAFVVRIFLFDGSVRCADAFAYAQYARDITIGGYNLSQVKFFYGFRYILLIPTALSYHLLGVSDISSSIFPLLCSILNIVAIFFIARRIFDVKIALIASILVVFYPLDIIYGSQLVPDCAIPFLSSLAVLCYVVGIDKTYRNWNYKVFLLLSGVFVGLAISARMTSIFLYGVFVIHQIAVRRKVIPIFWMSLGLMLPVGAEALYYYFSTGDMLFRIHQLAHLSSLVKGPDPKVFVSLWFYPKVMFGFDLTGLACYGFTWWLVIAGLFLAGLKKDKRVLFLLIWLVLPFLGLEFGTQSLKEMIPIIKDYRYLSLIEGPAIIIAAYFLVNLGEFLSSKVNLQHVSILAMLIIVIAGTNSYGAYRLYVDLKDDAAPYIAVADYLKKHQARVIYTHHFRWPLFLNYFLHYPENLEFRDMNKLDQAGVEQSSKAYVILHKIYLEVEAEGGQYHKLPWYARYVNSNPPGWEKVLCFHGRPEYNNVTMYYVR